MGYLPDTNDHAGWVVHRSGDLAVEEAEQLLLAAEELAAAAAKKLATALAADQKSHRTTTPEVALAEAEADAHAAGSLAASAERLAASAEELKAVAAAVKTKKNRSMAAAKEAAAPAPATAEKEMSCAGGVAAFCLLVFLMIGSTGGIAYLMSPPGGEGPDDQPEYPFNYSAAINSVSGLDATTTDHGLSSSLDPSFNLTLRVTSTSPQRKSCVEPGMYMEVSYRRVVLATSPTTQEQLCVGPKEAMDQRIVAKGVGVRVAGAVFDSLMADMRRYVLVFQVTLRRADKHADDVVVKSCGGRLVGAGDDLETMCNTPLPLHKSYGDSD